MRIHNLYTDADGQSHFRDIEVEFVEERRGSKLSRRLPANGIIFRVTPAEHDLDYRTHFERRMRLHGRPQDCSRRRGSDPSPVAGFVKREA